MSTPNEKAKCKQKTRYANDYDAQEAVKWIKSKHGASRSLRIYSCPVCAGKHITSSPKK